MPFTLLLAVMLIEIAAFEMGFGTLGVFLALPVIALWGLCRDD